MKYFAKNIYIIQITNINACKVWKESKLRHLKSPEILFIIKGEIIAAAYLTGLKHVFSKQHLLSASGKCSMSLLLFQNKAK